MLSSSKFHINSLRPKNGERERTKFQIPSLVMNANLFGSKLQFLLPFSSLPIHLKRSELLHSFTRKWQKYFISYCFSTTNAVVCTCIHVVQSNDNSIDFISNFRNFQTPTESKIHRKKNISIPLSPDNMSSKFITKLCK